MMMISKLTRGTVAISLAVLAMSSGAAAQSVAPCSGNCARLTVGNASGGAGGTATVPISFAQASSNGVAGGPDEVAAIAFSLNLSGNETVPLRLASCAFGADGLPAAVRPNSALSNFRVVVENASCVGKTHCLCPDGGGTADNFINVVVYGPNPLPTPGPGPIEIPSLPSGTLIEIDLAVDGGVATGVVIPLHVVNEVDDAERPAFRAFLSIGDGNAVDQTCIPVGGTPPCGGNSPVSQITVAHGSVTVQASCVGDCDGSGDVTVDEIVTMVNIALGSQPPGSCLAGDENGDGAVTVDEIIKALNNALGGCSS